MTSQIHTFNTTEESQKPKECRPPANAPKEYCQKLRSGIARLETMIRRQYEEAFPSGGDWIAQAVREAEEAAWKTPFPSLFFPPLAHLRVNEMMPLA